MKSMPASTLSVRRSSTNGNARMIAKCRRFERAEKLANEAPVKMLGPLMLCIFPAVFVILLAPLLLQASKNVF